MCTLGDYLETSSIVLRGTLSATPIDDASMLPVGTRRAGCDGEHQRHAARGRCLAFVYADADSLCRSAT